MDTLGAAVLGAYEVVAGLGIVSWLAGAFVRETPLAEGLGGRYHVAAELATASMLLLGGALALIGGFQYGLTVLGLGMLLYATVNAAGKTMEGSRKVGGLMIGEGVATAAILLALLLAS